MKKTVKRILSGVLCIIMIVSAIPLGELAGVDWSEIFAFKANAANYAVGQIIEFGSYPQRQVTDNYLKARLAEQSYASDGKIVYDGKIYYRISSTQFYYNDPIKWKVLSVDSEGVLILAENVLDCFPYHSPRVAINWSSCLLRTWLNTTFYNNAFSSTEMQKIVTSHLKNGDNPKYGTDGGNDTKDKVFVLSLADALDEKLGFVNSINDSETRIAKPSSYARARGVGVSPYNGNSSWWLRTPGENRLHACYVGSNTGYLTYGGMYINGINSNNSNGVRPALKLNPDAEIFNTKNNSQYNLKITDSETNNPISGATVEFDGQSYTTSTDGAVTISVGNNADSSASVIISKENYSTETRKLYELNLYSTNTIGMTSIFNPSNLIKDFRLTGETIHGPTIEILGKKFPLFSFEAGIEIPMADIGFEYKIDTKNKKVEFILGIDNGYSYDSDMKWNEDYAQFKDFYKSFSSASDSEIRSKYFRLRKDLKKSKGQIGFDCDLNYAGFLEYDYSSGEMKYSDGGIVFIAAATVSEDVPFLHGICYVNFKVIGEVEGKITIAPLSSSAVDISTKISLALKPSFGAGVKIISKKLFYAEAGLEGNFTGSVKIPSDSFAQAFELYFGANCYFKMVGADIWDIADWHTNFPNFQLYPNTGQPQVTAFSLEEIDETDFELIDRSYLYAPSMYSLDGINKNNVFPYGSPRLIKLSDGRIVALYIFDDGTKSDINRTTLYYSIYENDTWSVPVPVFDSGFADFPVEICSDGTNIHAVWQRASQVYDDTYELADAMDKTELVYAVYNGEEWSEPVTVDTSDKYQFAYDIAENNGEVAIAWAENSENDYFLMSGTTTVYKKTLSDSVWSEETVVASEECITEVSVGYISNTASVAYTVDTDGDLSTSGDNEIYIDGVEITADTAEDYEISYQNGAFRWIKDGVLYSYNGSVSSMGMNVEGDYRIITNGTQTAVTYITTEGFKNEIMISYLLSDGTYSQPVALTDYDRHITFYDVVLNDDGTTTLIADVENLSEEEGIYPYTTTDMVCEVLGKSVDLAVENVFADGAFTRGGTVYFNGTVVNKSTSAVDNYSIAVVDESGNILRSTTVWSDILSGESESFSLEYVLPEDFSKQNISVIVMVDDDKDTSNNFYDFELGYSDISVTGASINESGEITAIVVNNGCDTAENVTVDITAFGTEETLLSTVDCGNIAPDETYNISFNVDPAYLEFDSPYAVNKFRLAAETSSVEVSTGNNDADAVYAPTPAEGITISSDKMTLISGSSTQLVATVYPSEAYNQKIHWVSDSTDVVTVDENGNIQAVSGGTAIITAISDDGGYVASCEITSVVKVSSISMTEETAIINVGQTKTLKYEIDPDTASDKSVIWDSSDISVATVSDTGVITALESGVTTVTVTTVDGDFSDSCEITVINAVTGITISDVTASICLDNQKQLSAQVAPLDADNTSITWKSSDDYIVTVDETGLITAVGTGTATITATSVDGGYTATCKVTVGRHVSDVLLSEQSITVKPGLAHQLNATVLPLNATDKSVEWLSINENIAAVDENGVVTGVGLGETSIVVSTIDGGYYAICEVVVTGYSVEYYSDGNLYFSEYLFEGEELTIPDTPTREGYTFVKWSPDVAETMSNENLVYEAVWEPNVHNVSFIVDGETYYSYQCSYSDAITTPDIPQIEGYSFVGWTPAVPETMPNTDITFTAVFELATYTATFVADGAVISSQTFTIEIESLDEPPVPQKAGYYACWSGYKIEAKDITIVAQYHLPDVFVVSKRTLDIGDTYRLLSSCNFEVTDKSWKSSDTSVATVNQNGKVTAVGEGECKITVTCYGKDSLGNDVQASESTEIIVNGKSETTNIKQSFREKFDKFFEETLHELLYNFKEFMIVLFRYVY